jgi:hypothetical protein
MTEFDDSLHQSLGGHRATKGRQPGSVAATFGSFNVMSWPLSTPRGKFAPRGSGGDRSGADCQKDSNSDNFTLKSKIDHGFLLGHPVYHPPRPDPVPVLQPRWFTSLILMVLSPQVWGSKFEITAKGPQKEF